VIGRQAVDRLNITSLRVTMARQPAILASTGAGLLLVGLADEQAILWTTRRQGDSGEGRPRQFPHETYVAAVSSPLVRRWLVPLCCRGRAPALMRPLGVTRQADGDLEAGNARAVMRRQTGHHDSPQYLRDHQRDPATAVLAINMAMVASVFPAALRVVQDAPGGFHWALLDVRGAVGLAVSSVRLAT
jgi:hypothetical protein